MMAAMPTFRWLAGALAALACGVSACGGGDGQAVPGADAERATPSPTPTTTPRADSTPAPDGGPTPAPGEAPSGEVDPADVQVVRDWADTLRRGDVRAAARYFALPSLVSNGTPPIKLETRAEAVFFNRTLPCGAEVIDAEPARTEGFFIATFRLTERPGRGECGTGTGQTARTAFRVRDDRITDWLRVQDIPDAPQVLS